MHTLERQEWYKNINNTILGAGEILSASTWQRKIEFVFLS